MMRRLLMAALTGLMVLSGCADDPAGPRPGPAPAVASVEITPLTPLEVEEGGELQLNVIVRAADGTVLQNRAVAWSTSDDSIAGITAAGVLQGSRYGSAQVIAQVEGVADTAAVVVQSLVARIELPLAELTLDMDEVTLITAVLRGRDGMALNRVMTWTSDNPAVVTAVAPGRLRGVGSGRAVVTVTSEGRSASLEVAVTEWRRLILTRVDGAPLPAVVTIADSAGTDVTLSAFDLQQGVLRRGPEQRYELHLHGLTAAGPRVIVSSGEVMYHFLEGYPMLVRDGPEWYNRPPHFRGVVAPPAGEFPLTGALTGIGPEVELTFRVP